MIELCCQLLGSTNYCKNVLQDLKQFQSAYSLLQNVTMNYVP